MGYPEHNFRISRPTFIVVLVLLLSIGFPAMNGFTAHPRPHDGLPHGRWDHVIITDQSLKPIFAPLAKHRKSQGLRCRIVSTKSIASWSGLDDKTEAIRWFVAAAHRDWGTRYVLLGGGPDIIPIPLGYFESLNFSWEIPLDLYYAAPGGDWDLDGDGYLGEFEDDDPDLVPVVALGRAPVADRAEAGAFVTRVIAYENREAGDGHDTLLAAEVGIPHPWTPGMPVQMDFAQETENLAEILVAAGLVGDLQRLYQNPDAPHYEVPLSAWNFLDELADGRHRYVGMMNRGASGNWSMGPDMLTPALVEESEGLDHPFFLAANIFEAADFRQESVLKTLVARKGGGCAGGLAPSAAYYLYSSIPFYREFWQALLENEQVRVGDAYRLALENRLGSDQAGNAATVATLQCQTVVGDPALLFHPAGGRERTVAPVTARVLAATVSPNPFNPVTEISFVIPETAGGRVPVGIDIYDLGGRRVTRLLKTALGPGAHSASWFGRDDSGRKVGSGVYFAHVRAGEMRTVEKLVLLE